MKKVLLLSLIVAVAFIGFILIRTFTFSSQQLNVQSIEKSEIPEGALGRFQEALRIQTISFENQVDFDTLQFEKFNQFIINNYPLMDSLLDHQIFSEFSHLYHWKGKDTTLNPIILMGHLDVVPIASPDSWTKDPFGGVIADEKVWGRGTIDDKFSVIAIMETVEDFLVDSFQPERSIYLAFGHDEEVGGDMGAVQIAKYLKNKGVKAEYVLDEGYAITQKLIPGIQDDVALIGIAEKGSATIKFSIDLVGGHSSQPAMETAIDVLAAAIANLKSKPLGANISEPMNGFMDQLGPEMGFLNKMAFANREIFKGLIISTYESTSGAGNALVRTTTAPTIFNGGVKENVIPTSAYALVNFRIMPGETPQSVLEYANSIINDERVKLSFHGFNTNPSEVSPIDSKGYEAINMTIKQVFDNTLTGPNLVIAATDSRHFSEISENIYRFVPYHINENNINSFHGVDEHILVEDYKDAIRFYRQLILNSTAD